ncbi:MAG: glucose-6-phosphate isomerase [Clostridiales bacterium]|nr:glucose-6-phosphate isomerase [Clostridiales bacterium]
MMDDAIRLDIKQMMADYLGMQYGIDRAAVDDLIPQLHLAHQAVEANRGKGMQGWMELPYNQAQIVEQIEREADRIRDRFDAFVVLGIGGSALGPSAVQQALSHLRYNELPAEKRGGPRLYVEDNIDPERMASLMDVIDLKKTCFNVITKSGGTAETMSQYLILRDALKRAVGDSYAEHIVATTSAERGNLIKIARKEGFSTFIIPDGVGGRFSELSPVGLLAAAVCGIDIRGLLGGARRMDQRLKNPDPWQNPALLEAALMYVAMRDMDVNISVMMPYADSLRLIADWYAQLWAESLGKNVTRRGMAVNVGQTPAKALGVTDQHSQLQLFTEGPYDKVITFLKVDSFRANTPIPHGCEEIPDVAFLGGRSHNELIEAERAGTEYALYKAGRMSQTITLPSVTPSTVGQLLYFFEMVTAYAGELLDIDAFNQPGVEESKLAAYAVLGHPADKYAAKRAEMAARPARKAEYLL